MMRRLNHDVLALNTVVAASLFACAPQTTGSAPRGDQLPDAVSICASYGFASGTKSFEACAAKLDHLIQVHETNERRCEAARQDALRTTPSGNLAGGFGTSWVNADAAYQFCLNERAPPPVQLELPNGQAVTCEQIENHVHCN
jgi:hypothetical protein